MSRDTSYAVAKARGLIKEFGITKPKEIDAEAISFLKGALVREADLKGMSGRLIRRGNHAVITINANIRESGQKRFTIAHELGHMLLHEKDNQLSVCRDEQFLAWYRDDPIEVDANAFAAELLMPADLFRQNCQAHPFELGVIKNIANEFSTTLTATAVRYVEIGPHICALVVSTAGILRWFRAGTDFIFRILPPGTRIDADSCASDFFEGKGNSPICEKVKAMCWLEDSRLESRHTLTELAIALPSYNTVLSILCIDPGSELDRLED